MPRNEKWIGGIVVKLRSGATWAAEWNFSARPGCSKPARVLRTARRSMAEEKVEGRSKWLRYTIVVELPE